MANAVDICNLALSSLGDSATVTSINPPDGSAQAGHCSRWFPIALRRVYEEYDWSFATRREYLVETKGHDVTLYPGKFLFGLPANYVRIVNVFDVDQKFGKELPIEFDIESINGIPYIITTSKTPVIKYIKYSEQTVLLPGYFVDCLVPLLASMLVGALKRGDSSSSVAANLLKEYQTLLSQAKTLDSSMSQYHIKKHSYSSIKSRAV